MRPTIAGRFRTALTGALVLAVAGCATPPTPCPDPAAGTRVIYLTSHGWHTDIGLPVDELDGPLAAFRRVFPGARAIMFGYGKRTFLTAPPDSLSEYVLGPVPGPAALQITGLAVLPTEAYRPGDTTVLRLSPEGEAALAGFIWNELGKDAAGRPKYIGPGWYKGTLFYAARSEYALLHTCNTWTAEALAAAGLPIGSDGVVFSGQVVARAERAEAGQCVAAAPARP